MSGGAEPLLELRPGRPRPVEWVGREVGPAVVRNVHDRRVRQRVHLAGGSRDEVAVVPPVAAAQDGAIGQRVRKPEARLEVVGVVRTRLGDHRRQDDLVRVDVHGKVVPQAEVQRQPRGDLPIILHPRRRVVLGQRIAELASAERVAADDGRERRQIPGGHVVPHGKQGFDVGGNGSSLRIDGAHAVETAERGVDRIQVFPAELHVVPPAAVERQRHVVAKLIDVRAAVLRRPDVAADLEAAERNARVAERDAVGRLRVIGARRVVAGLVVVAVEAGPDLVHQSV